jgi:hypothetical protein
LLDDKLFEVSTFEYLNIHKTILKIISSIVAVANSFEIKANDVSKIDDDKRFGFNTSSINKNSICLKSFDGQ